VHSEGLKAEYEAASAHEKSKWGFEYDYLRDMQKYIDDCNRRIDGAQRRLEKTPDEIRQTNNLVYISRVIPSHVWDSYKSNLRVGTGSVYTLETRLTPQPVKANFRPEQNHQRWPPRGLCPWRTRLRRYSANRIPQGPHRKTPKGNL
jgi:hypothetical protein